MLAYKDEALDRIVHLGERRSARGVVAIDSRGRSLRRFEGTR